MNLGLQRFRRPLINWLTYNRSASFPCRRLTSNGPSQPFAMEQSRKSGSSKRDYAPRPLTHPLGLSKPPLAGENSGEDSRTWKEKKEDMLNREKNLDEREKLKSEFTTSYFADFNAISKEHQGKSWIAPQALFRKDLARYFPNLQGKTLASPEETTDTTNVLRRKVSLVSVFSSVWAERQVSTFVDNEPVKELLRKYNGLLQKVDINIEENALKVGLIRLFIGGLRRKIPEEDHGKYFIVTKGLTHDIRGNMGLLNSKVGYVYLLDPECKIRWAGSGNASMEEKESLVRLMDKLGDTHYKRLPSERTILKIMMEDL